jgi:VanZ family protein
VRSAGRAAWWLFAVAVVANLLLLFWPRSPGTAGIPHLDKAVHLVSFAFVAWTGARAGIAIRALVAVLTVHAIASELIQHALLPGRSGDPADVLADLAGVAGVALALGAASWRHGRDRRRACHDGAAPRREPGPG